MLFLFFTKCTTKWQVPRQQGRPTSLSTCWEGPGFSLHTQTPSFIPSFSFLPPPRGSPPCRVDSNTEQPHRQPQPLRRHHQSQRPPVRCCSSAPHRRTHHAVSQCGSLMQTRRGACWALREVARDLRTFYCGHLTLGLTPLTYPLTVTLPTPARCAPSVIE